MFRTNKKSEYVMEPKRFEIGKYYKHSGGESMHIIGVVNTNLYGWTLVAESSCAGDLKPITPDEGCGVGWKEIAVKEWEKLFSKD